LPPPASNSFPTRRSSDLGVEDRHPRLPPVQRDIVLAGGCEGLGLRQGGVRAPELARHQIVARQVVPGSRVLVLVPRSHRLCKDALGVLQILGALIRELGARRALERLHAAVHALVARLDVACGGKPDLLRMRRGGGQSGDQDTRRNAEGLLDGQAHSLDLATSASASRCATRATSSGGRPSTRAAATTSSYSGLTPTPSAPACSSTFTRTVTSGASSMVTWRRASVARSASQRRTPPVVLCRNSAAVTGSANSSGA